MGRSSGQQSKEPGARSEEEEEHRKGKRRRKHRNSGEERRRHGRRRKSGDKSGSHAEFLSSESDGPVDLDEVEVVENTELVVMGSSSSSSSSTSTSRDGSPCCGQDDNGAIDLDSSGVVSL